MPGLQKRSLVLAGHRTSLALESEFWSVLETAALQRTLTLPALVVEIDAARGTGTPDRLLASACRVYALSWALNRPRDYCGPT